MLQSVTRLSLCALAFGALIFGLAIYGPQSASKPRLPDSFTIDSYGSIWPEVCDRVTTGSDSHVLCHFQRPYGDPRGDALLRCIAQAGKWVSAEDCPAGQ